jgi:Bacterial regulatory proteins, tetR family
MPSDGEQEEQTIPAMSDDDVAILSDLLGVTLSERGRSRVQVIIAAVDAMLEEHGQHDLRIADVAKKAGTSSGTIYHLFGSREGLIKAARASVPSGNPDDRGGDRDTRPAGHVCGGVCRSARGRDP